MKFETLQRIVSICSLIGKQISFTISRLRNLLFTKSFSWSKLFPIRVLRELKFFLRNSGKNPTTDANNENLPLKQTVSSASQQDADPSKLPFSAIQEAERNLRFGLDQETHFRRKSEKTPSKSQAKGSDQFFQSRTQDKLPASKGKFGWVPIVEQAGLASPERREYSLHQGQLQVPPPPPLMANHALNFGNGYSAATPHSIATGGRASSVHSGTSSTQSTPTKSVSKPMTNGVSNSRAPQCGGTAKTMNFSVSSKKIPLSSAPPPVYASVEVPHFELKEDPSFCMDHNVQDPCLTSPKKVPCSCSTKHAEEVLYLEKELDRLKTIIAVEKSSRVEAEERAILSEAELSIINDKLLLISKRYDATIDKLKDTRSVIEALEPQQMLSNNELEELRENNNQLADIVKIQEQQISTMKKQLALRIDVGNRKSIIAHEILRGDYSESECSSLFQDKLKRVQASLEKAWNLNMRYQSDQTSHSSEREMTEVRRQVEAETAEVIVCLQEELTTINQIVDECNKNELLAKQRLMDLEKEKKEQDDKLYLLTLENIRLAKLTKEKEHDASSIMEHWEQLAIEILDLF